jgi:hypothetical protein
LGAGQVNDLRMLSIDEVLKAGPGGPSKSELVDGIIFNDNLDADGYAWAWALSHYFGEKKRDVFFQYVAEVAKLGPLEKMEESKQRELFASHFGADREQVGTDLWNHVKKLPYRDPIENMKHYVVLYRYRMGSYIYSGYAVTTSPAEIQKKKDELRAKLDAYAQQSAIFEVKPFPTRTKALAFAKAISGKSR